jgi:integrase
VKGDVVTWRNSLVVSGLTVKTVKDVKLAALRAAFHRAHSDGVLSSNPAAGVETGSTKSIGGGGRGREFSEEEAQQILSLALKQARGRRSVERARAIRWVPWIGAYTGARINEIAQLRGVDFTKRADGHYMRFTPDAGSIKSGKYRDVPVHRDLIRQGLLELVKEVGEGPLFHNRPKPVEASAMAADQVSAHLREWVRKVVGITDKRVQPNHAWRHRFATVARKEGVSDEARNYILGHALPGMAAIYGTMAGLAMQMEKVPDIELPE